MDSSTSSLSEQQVQYGERATRMAAMFHELAESIRGAAPPAVQKFNATLARLLSSLAAELAAAESATLLAELAANGGDHRDVELLSVLISGGFQVAEVGVGPPVNLSEDPDGGAVLYIENGALRLVAPPTEKERVC